MQALRLHNYLKKTDNCISRVYYTAVYITHVHQFFASLMVVHPEAILGLLCREV